MKLFNKEVTYDRIKDNISMIILVPTLMGGIWQLLELTSIGTAYLRFFSLSQLVPDGILVLFSFGLILSTSWTILKSLSLISFIKNQMVHETPKIESIDSDTANPLVSKKPKAFVKSTQSSWMTKRDGYICIAVLVGINAFLIVSHWQKLNVTYKSGKSVPLIVLMITFVFISIFITSIKLIIETILDIHKWKINIANRKIKNMYDWIFMMLFLACLIFGINILLVFHRSFALPDDLKNKSYLDHKIKENNPNIKSFEIRYFNDKYIFVNITDSSKHVVTEVFKFEDFIPTKPGN